MQRSYHLIKQVAKVSNLDLFAFNQKALLSQNEKVSAAIDEFKQYCRNVYVTEIPCEQNRYGKHLLAALSFFTILPYTVNWLHSHTVHKQIKKLIQQNHYDLIWLDTISFAPYLRYCNSSKVVMNHHNIESEMMFRRAEKEHGILKKGYYFQEATKLRHVEKKYCPVCTLNVTCSELDSRRLETILPGLKTAVVPNGVDIEYFKPANALQEKCSMVFAGDMSWYPNREAMVYLAEKVWSLLKSSIPQIKMTVIGKNAPSELQKLSKIDNNFIVTGFVDDVRPYIGKAAIYVCPIMNGGGTKLKILDALSMGKAIVAHPIACEGIAVVDGESVLFADTPEAFLQKIQLLLNNDKLRTKLETNGRLLVEKLYSFDYIGQNLKKELDLLVG